MPSTFCRIGGDVSGAGCCPVFMLGARLTRAGERRRFDPHRRRRLSFFQLGLMMLRGALAQARYHELRLDRLFLYPT
ncbi:hypothetical protein [Zavarzinella formosa]|uniref:hypothetical protein n=1 Tax=Zavarzinella formosa TaxID=360055 RepID=UPI0012FCA368|nr:hypothetical protein [Zavarzinella formosa]